MKPCDNMIVFIYGLIDPRTEKIRYIGWTYEIKQRLEKHCFPSEYNKDTYKCHWIKQLISLEMKPDIMILEECMYAERGEREKWWIAYFGRENLTNSTDGGEGVIGFNHTEESKIKMSKGKKGVSAWWLKGKSLSLEAKERIRRANLGRKHTEETKNKMSKSQRGRIVSEIGRKNISKAKIGKTFSEDAKKNMSKGQIGKIHSKEQNEKTSMSEMGIKHGGTSLYSGVSFDASRNKWAANLYVNRKKMFIGRFETEIEAALAWNEAAIEYYGWKVKLNNISQSEMDDFWKDSPLDEE